MATTGYRQLSRQLSAMGQAAGGKALRSAAMTATLPALKAARSAAPVANPPYTTKGGKTVDPYPVRTHKGRLRTPGFARGNIARKSKLSRDKTRVTVMIGVKPEAFYAVSFFELGTSKSPPRPWLEPSFRESTPQIDTRFRSELKKRIDKAAKK